MIPSNYQEWKNCITQDCKIELSNSFIEQRLLILKNSDNKETLKFKELYGTTHLINTIDWFETAKSELIF